jgi:hypothetical protein
MGGLFVDLHAANDQVIAVLRLLEDRDDDVFPID